METSCIHEITMKILKIRIIICQWLFFFTVRADELKADKEARRKEV